MEDIMADDSEMTNQDAVSSKIEKAQNLRKETLQQFTGLTKPESYGTIRMVNASDNISDTDMERIYG
jgi:hypothetical protein